MLWNRVAHGDATSRPRNEAEAVFRRETPSAATEDIANLQEVIEGAVKIK